MNNTIAIYPGSFDPITNGHLDVIERASKVVDKLIVGVLVNSSKRPLFSAEERVTMIREMTKHLDNVEVASFEGLTIDFAHQNGARVIVRGLRAITDFDYELQMAQTNRILAPDVDTMFFSTSLQYSYLSSSTVKEIAKYHGDISMCVPEYVARLIEDKMKEI
ncbi:MAG: pantetheine-phosphate adenylyltransferase [Lachnospiraceae bacterium]|nr:pantetheine-phosphate adenylyltransferase [Lachnospiraceae bacterium]